MSLEEINKLLAFAIRNIAETGKKIGFMWKSISDKGDIINESDN